MIIKRFWIWTVVIAIGVGVTVWTLRNNLIQENQPRKPLETVQNELMNSRFFDARQIKVGEQKAGLVVKEIKEGTHGVNSYTVVFEGAVQLKGTYEYTTSENAYNSRMVIFIPNDESAAKLPKPENLKQSNRFMLEFTKSDDAARFGVPGASGTAEITISQYESVQAEILEGVSDSGMFAQALDIKMTLPPKPEIANADFNKTMAEFPKLGLPMEIIEAKAAEKVWAWLLEVDKTYVNGMNYNGKPISEGQREQVRAWLELAFTQEKTEDMLNQSVGPTDGGYLIGEGTSGMKPPFRIKDIQAAKLTEIQVGVYAYEVKLIADGGTHDALLTCKLVWKDSQWKIEEAGYKLI